MKRALIAVICCVFVCLQLVPCFAINSGLQIETNEDGSCFVISNEPLSSFTPGDEAIPGTPGDSAPGITSQGGNGLLNESELNALTRLFQKIINALIRLIGKINNQHDVTKTKYIYYYSSENILLWSGELTGEFLYSSSSAKCIDSTFLFTSYDNNWQLDDYACTKNGATASVTFFVVQKSLGVKLQTITKTISLTCDNNGNVA